MKHHFGYIRVSTTKQGEQGSSLPEQKAAIEAYARQHGLTIVEWFEEQETAATHGRPLFNEMLRRLERGQARGVITHKIDRSARNLKDWARLGELVDRGIELHFAHESLDLMSRSGRLSADILAVVAADYIRNLRDEVRKGFYGRLKQGLYPLQAPIGYLDQGGGKPKTIDPVAGPLVRAAFELYRTGEWSLHSLCAELYRRGLRTRRGGRLSRASLSVILNSGFYAGIIKIQKTGEVFQGIHEPLVDMILFDQVQAVLQGRTPHRGRQRRHRYQRLIRCGRCSYSLVAELQKGHVYYRCHTRNCPRECVREDRIDQSIGAMCRSLSLTEAQWQVVRRDILVALGDQRAERQKVRTRIEFQRKAIDERLARLTDAYVDGVLEKDLFLRRKENLLRDDANLRASLANFDSEGLAARHHAEKILELGKRLGCLAESPENVAVDELFANTISNLSVRSKELAVDWQIPFAELVRCSGVQSSPPCPAKPRTSEVVRIIKDYLATLRPANDNHLDRERRAA